jgi:hypothetical protein
VKSFLNQYGSNNWTFEIEKHLSSIVGCHLLPGFLDCFTNDEYDQEKNSLKMEKIMGYEFLEPKLFKFLLSHRFTTEMINQQYLNSRIMLSDLRRKILIEIEKKIQDETKSTC